MRSTRPQHTFVKTLMRTALLSLALACVTERVRAQAAPQSLVKALPSWAGLVVRFDLSEKNNSARYLRELAKNEKLDGLRNLLLGLAQLGLQQAGTQLDLDRDLLSWLGDEALIAFEPAAPEPKVAGAQSPAAAKKENKDRILVLAAVKDAEAANRYLFSVLNALKSKSPNDIASETIAGATVWRLGKEKEAKSAGSLIGFVTIHRGAVGYSDNKETMTSWLNDKSDDALTSRMTAELAKVKSNLVSFYVDQVFIGREDLLPDKNPAQQFFKVKSIAGGLGLNERGVQFEATVNVGEGSGLTKLANSIPSPTNKALNAIPADALAVATAAQPNGFLGGLPLPFDPIAIISSFGGQALNNFPAEVIGGMMKSEPIVAVTAIGKVPEAIVCLAIENEDIAKRAFKAFNDTLTPMAALKVSSEEISGRAVTKFEVIGQSDAPPFHLSQEGAYLLLTTSADAMKKSLDTLAGKSKSIATSADYKRAAEQSAGKPLVGLYANPTVLLSQTVSTVLRESGLNNKYLELAAEQLTQSFKSLAVNATLEPTAAHLVISAGVDYGTLQANAGANALPLVRLLLKPSNVK